MTKCSDPAKPGTIAHIKCRDRYERQGKQQIVSCGENGKWNTLPEACSQICGEISTEGAPFSVGSSYTEIKLAPWHVGIYQFDGTSYAIRCGGTIINARLVLSAMHCFWDRSENKTCNTYSKNILKF